MESVVLSAPGSSRPTGGVGGTAATRLAAEACATSFALLHSILFIDQYSIFQDYVRDYVLLCCYWTDGQVRRSAGLGGQGARHILPDPLMHRQSHARSLLLCRLNLTRKPNKRPSTKPRSPKQAEAAGCENAVRDSIHHRSPGAHRCDSSKEYLQVPSNAAYEGVQE